MAGKFLFKPSGKFGIEKHPHLAAFTIQKAKGGHAGFYSIVELALNSRRGAWQAGVKGMQWIASMVAQSTEERHATRIHGRFDLAPRQAVYLNEEETRFFAGARAGGKAKMTNRPFVAA